METVNAFVAMFDIIGFKKLREKCGSSWLYELYTKSVLPQIQHSAALKSKIIAEGGTLACIPNIGEYSLIYRIISDSILLFTKNNSLEEFTKIVDASYQLLSFSFCGHKAPLRGAIGYGDLILDDDSIWLGSAIEDAYAGESGQCWAGCCLTEACEEFAKKFGMIEQYNSLNALPKLLPYKIPRQSNPKSAPVKYFYSDGFALNWTINVSQGVSSKAFNQTTDCHALKIQENTMDFELWARSQKKQLRGDN